MVQKIKELFVLLIRLLPLRKSIVFESHPDFSDNTYALYRELVRRGVNRRYRFYWILTFRDGVPPRIDEPNVYTFHKEPAGLMETLRRAYVLNSCQVILDSNSFIYKRRKKQIRFHLGHGMPVKIDLDYSRKFGDCDKYMVQSEFWHDIFTEQIHVPEEKLCDAGYPRNDVLVHPVSNQSWRASVAGFDKVIVWMPTYRQHRLHKERAMEQGYPYGLPLVSGIGELERLQETLLRKRTLILFRPHPVQDLSAFTSRPLSQIRIADDRYLAKFGMTLYELLSQSDALITDYSSVYFDYLLTDKPIALTIGDLEEYFQHFTPAFSDYKANIAGFYAETFGELLDFLEQTADGEDRCREARRAAKARFHTDVSGNSAARIADILKEEYGIY